MPTITDSGARGALIVVDLESGEARRLLDGHPSTQVEKGVVVTHRGEPVRRPDGRSPEFAADSIELSNDGETLYWKALTGRTLYPIATDVLDNANASEDEVASAAQTVGETVVTDGLWSTKGASSICQRLRKTLSRGTAKPLRPSFRTSACGGRTRLARVQTARSTSHPPE